MHPLCVRRWVAAGLFSFFSVTLPAVPLPSPLEPLQRGVVALKQPDGRVFVSWRLLGSDPAGTSFNLYRANGEGAPVKLNPSPLTGPTSYSDLSPGQGRLRYFVRPIFQDKEYDPSTAFSLDGDARARAWLEIPLQPPASGTTRPWGKFADGEAYTYSANDGSIGDVDGDGVLEFFVKWDPSNAHDNSHAGVTGNTYFDAYRMDGTRLWRIDLGRNIRSGAHYTQFIVYDFDGDGKAELACKTADGTVDGKGKAIGDVKADHRNDAGYILRGPEFLTVFNGLTGAAIDTVPYTPGRHPETQNPTFEQLKALWGDGYGNRFDRFNAAAACLDGKSASLIMARGYYTRTVVVAWDLKGGKLVRRWLFDSDTGPASNRAYAGQGNHQISIADVDNDGRDEIVYGAMVLDDDGTGLHSTGLGHGDALHVSDLDPKRPGLEIFDIQERFDDAGAHFREADTGKILWKKPSVKAGDDHEGPGRGNALDIDPRYPGTECWVKGAGIGALFDARGKLISATAPGPCNFGVWWDGDPQRELLDRAHINKWNWKNSTETRLLSAEGCAWNNGTKATPVLSGDILGDWREEVVWRTEDSSALRIYVSPVPTPYRCVTLLHDRQYRFALAWQNVGYNQPPHPSFDMATRLSTSSR
jgi:rhamnogalacturonan endolyase